MNIENDIIKRQSVNDMAAAYELAVQHITQAGALFKTANERLALAFESRFGFECTRNGRDIWDAKTTLKSLRSHAWRAIIEKMELRHMMSTKRRDELDKSIQDGELPEITAENIFATCAGLIDNVHDYLNEAVQEVFDFLRPPHSRYKTNSEFEIGKRVIVRVCYYTGWNHPHIDYNDQNLSNLHNVFALLDGCGPCKTYHGPIHDAVQSMECFGIVKETEYFRLKICKNGNMHVEFKRPDLVKKLNEIAGGNRLRAAG